MALLFASHCSIEVTGCAHFHLNLHLHTGTRKIRLSSDSFSVFGSHILDSRNYRLRSICCEHSPVKLCRFEHFEYYPINSRLLTFNSFTYRFTCWRKH